MTAGRLRQGSAQAGVNVSEAERWLSLAGGGLLALGGLSRGSVEGLVAAGLGGALLYRGLTGHCPMYQTLGVSTAEGHGKAAAVAAGHGFKVEKAVTINRPAEELYRTWRNFDGLPRFMRHLVSVKSEGNRSHWVARGPAGTTVEWDAEVVNDQPGRLIAWRSLEGSRVSTAGSVHYDPAPGGRGTEVRVSLKYDPPGGKLGSWLAWLFGEEPGQQVQEDLRHFKQLTEAGEIPTTEGQPACRHG
jgi:uncharacterized membrane protein